LKKSTILKKMFQEPGIIVAPGAYDALSAKLIERAGFKVVQHSGYGTAATLLAKPDVGLIDFSEMCNQIKSIARAVSIPVIGDADTGYGNALNVNRTVKEYIWAGAAGLFIEDQKWPKRCGHMFGKEVISKEEMMGKIKAAIDTKNEEDPDFMICFRTDAVAVNGIDDAIDRAKAAVDLGVDYVFIEAYENRNQMEKALKEIKTPIMLNIIEGGKTPLVSVKEAKNMGFKIVVFSLTTLYSAAKGMADVLKILKEEGSVESYIDNLTTFSDFAKIVNTKEVREIEERYLPKKYLSEKYGVRKNIV